MQNHLAEPDYVTRDDALIWLFALWEQPKRRGGCGIFEEPA